jgi:hypothetical protein
VTREEGIIPLELTHEALGVPLVPLRLHEDVGHFALGIDGAPEIH